MYSLTNECKCIHMCAHTHFFTPYKAAGSVEKKKREKKKEYLPSSSNKAQSTESAGDLYISTFKTVQGTACCYPVMCGLTFKNHVQYTTLWEY